VFLNKYNIIDDEEQLKLVETEVRKLLYNYDFPSDNIPIIKGLAQQALDREGAKFSERAIIRLGEALDVYIPAPVDIKSRLFFIPVEDIFSIAGRGVVAIGYIERGTIQVGDTVEVVGISSTLYTYISVEMFKKPLVIAQAGENVGILLRGLKREDIGRGNVLAMPGTTHRQADFRAEVYVLREDEGSRSTPFTNHYRSQFSFHNMDLTGSISLPRDREMVMPGDNLSITVKLSVPIMMEEGLHFAIREGGRTVGFGVVAALIK
jgi:elongation factor Tu